MSSFSIFRNRKQILPIIYQNEAAECGLACLAMMAGYYGHHISMVSLRRKFRVSPRGMTFKDIIEHARSLNLDARAIKISIEVINHVGLPCIIHWDLNHFVVLSHITESKVTIHDPNIGKRALTRKEFAKHFTGLMLEVVPSKEFKKHKEVRKLRISDLWGNLVGLKRGLTQLVVLSFFLQFVVLVNPVFLQLVVDDVLMNLNYDLLVILAVSFAALAILHGIALVVREFLIIYLGAALSYQMVSNLFSHLMKLPVSYFENRHLGDITSRFGSTDAIKKLVTEGIVSAVIDGIMGVTTLIIMCIYSPFLCFISALFWSVYFGARRISFFFYRELSEAELIAGAKERSYFIETVRALPMLKLYSGGRNRHTFWRNLSLTAIGTSADVRRAKSFYESLSVVVTGVELVAVTFFAAKMVLDTRFTVGMLLAYLAYRTTFVSRTITFIERIMEFKMLSLHLERISDIVYTEVEKHDDQIKVSDFSITGSIELKKVFYKYAENSPNVINNLSIHIKAGETIAIAGRTGCGKSTLFKILTSLFSPLEGSFLIDGIPLEDIGLENYRKQIGVVSQDNVLVSGTLLDNITMLDTNVDELDLYSACSIAGILDDILAMPMQFDTLIGDLGSTLSGGQKQRIAIARALYRKPRILFMDEGTSHLDIGMEKIITDGISRLNITCVLIAHRPETIRCANRVFEFSGGKVVEIEAAKIKVGESMIDLRISDFKAISVSEVNC